MSNIVYREDIRWRAIGFSIFVLWFGLVLLMVWHHAFWRDEVRALSAARYGDDVVAMLRNLDQGHPALWYLMLRGAYFIVGKPWVLPVLSIAVASAVVVLLVRSPLGWSLIAPLVFSYVVLFEYSVMARNYGISMLLLLLAACYRRHCDHGVLLGALLFLLANTNVHSTLLVAAFLLFWLIELLAKTGIRWTPALKTFLVNVCLAATGVAICAGTIYHTHDDAAIISRPEGLSLAQLLGAIFYPAGSFSELGISRRWDASGPTATLKEILDSTLIVGTLLSLVRWPAAFLAALSALIAFSLFFTIIYPGYFRHEALWLCFVVTLHWISCRNPPQLALRLPPRLEPIVECVARSGWMLLMSLVGLLTLLGVNEFAENVIYRMPLKSQPGVREVRARTARVAGGDHDRRSGLSSRSTALLYRKSDLPDARGAVREHRQVHQQRAPYAYP
jgi:hypothetical protein